MFMVIKLHYKKYSRIKGQCHKNIVFYQRRCCFIPTVNNRLLKLVWHYSILILFQNARLFYFIGSIRGPKVPLHWRTGYSIVQLLVEILKSKTIQIYCRSLLWSQYYFTTLKIFFPLQKCSTAIEIASPWTDTSW